MVEELDQHEIDACNGGKSVFEYLADAAVKAVREALDRLAGPNA